MDSLDVSTAAPLQHTLPSCSVHYPIWKQDGQMLLHPRVEFTQYEPLPVMELREGVRITCLASGIFCQQGADTGGSVSQHKRELVACGRALGDNHLWDSKPQRKREICPTEPTILTSSLVCLRRIIFLSFLPSLPSPALKQALAEMISSVLDDTLQHGQVSFSAVNRRNGWPTGSWEWWRNEPIWVYHNLKNSGIFSQMLQYYIFFMCTWSPVILIESILH